MSSRLKQKVNLATSLNVQIETYFCTLNTFELLNTVLISVKLLNIDEKQCNYCYLIMSLINAPDKVHNAQCLLR